MLALIATVKDEIEQIHEFLKSIESQTRVPDVVVISDGGSTDGTWEVLKAWDWGDRAPLDTVIMKVAGNRSRGRNLAIRQALKMKAKWSDEDFKIVACTNCSVLDRNWFAGIIAPLMFSSAQVVGGSYRIDARTEKEKAGAAVTQYSPAEVEKKKFVSALSMAFTAEAWEKVGGFPQDLDTSEDTVFVQKLRDAGFEFAYTSSAFTTWRPNTLTVRGAYRTYRKFAETDRKAGVKPVQYLFTLGAYTNALVLAMVFAPWFGFMVLWSYFVLRIRKTQGIVQPFYGFVFVVAVDIGRIRGYFFR